MTKKKENRKRPLDIHFRVTEEEKKRIEQRIKASGLTRQEYLISCLEKVPITVIGNPRTFIRLKSVMIEILGELERIKSSSEMDKEFMKLIEYLHDTYVRLIE